MMKRVFDLWVFIHCYSFLLSSISSAASTSYFIFDKDPFSKVHYVNDTFSIGGTFQLKCSDSQCLTNLKLSLKKDRHLSIDLWCDSSAILLSKKSDELEQPSCVLDGIDAVEGNYRFSVSVKAHTVGSFRMVFSATFPNNPGGNQEWSSEKIVIFAPPMDDRQSVQQSILKRKKRQDNITLDDTNVQPMVSQDGDAINPTANQIQPVPTSDTSNVMNPPIQLNTYTGAMNIGYTADFTCNGSNSCPDYPKVDDQGRLVCCFSLPQIPDGSTALSSVVYQNGAQNLNDFQVNVDNGQSFNAANDLSVFLGSTTPTSQCNVILPAGTIPSNDVQFRVTWAYHSNSTNLVLPPSVPSIIDGTLPVNILSVTNGLTFAQQTNQYNEWFVCPPSQDGQISLLRSIALLAGNNIYQLRCIFVNNQGIPLNDPTTGQLLVFTSSQNSASDNPTITNLPNVHTDCIAIQFFPNNGTTIDLNSILLIITIAFQTAPTTNIASVMPQVSDLQGTSQVQVDVSIDVSPINNNNVGDTGQTNTQIPFSAIINNSSNDQSTSCSSYQFDVPMSFNITIGEYTGTFDVVSQISPSTILQSIVVTGSSAVQNPITMIYADNQGNTLSGPISFNLGDTLRNDLQIMISKIILQATALQDASMDSSLHAEMVVCPVGTGLVNPSLSESSSLIAEAQVDSSSQSTQSPTSVSSDSSIDCQERTASTYGTYPPDLSATPIPTKEPGTDVTTSTPASNSTIQTMPDHICFHGLTFSNNSFLYDIQVSTPDYTNPVDCLSPASGCSINFTSTKQPKITLLFTTHTCISSIRVPSPSNVQSFSFSVFDENGYQIRLPEATDGRGTLLSSSGTNATVQMNQYACGYSIILQLLATNDDGPPTSVTIDVDGCFRNFSATTTTITSTSPSMSFNDFSTSSSQQVSSSPSPDTQSVASTSSPALASLSVSAMGGQPYPAPTISPSVIPILPLEKQILPLSQTPLSPSSSVAVMSASPASLPSPSSSLSPPSSAIASISSPASPALPSIVSTQQPVPMSSEPPQTPSLAITSTPTVSVFQPVAAQLSPQFIAPVPPQPIVLQTTAPPSQVSAMPTDTCPQITITTHPGVELVIFSDGTNVTSDLDPDGKGCNLASTGTTMTVLLRTGMSATFSSVGVSSSNVNQIEVALFDEASNRPLLPSPQGTVRSALTLNPTVQNLPTNPAATLTVTFLSTVDGQPPRNAILLVHACFPTTNLTPPSTVMTQSINTFNEQIYIPADPIAETYPFYQESQLPTNICIDSFQPSQVTSVANIALPLEYHSSNQCVCVCQSGIAIPGSSGMIQYYPPPTAKTSAQRRRKRQTK